jgi:AcrR family transcriptional regulator
VAQILVAARTVLAAEGPHALTMRRLAAELGIQAPSLYKHLPGKPAVIEALIAVALAELGSAVHDSLRRTRRGREVAALLRAYRAWALAEPNLYRLASAGPLPREALPSGLLRWAAEPFHVVAGEPGLARALWSYAHGMVVWELDGRHPAGPELDATWSAGAAAFQAARPLT